MTIGSDEPEANVLMVHYACPECGGRIEFNFWNMVRGETIACPTCGHKARRGPLHHYDSRTDEWTTID